MGIHPPEEIAGQKFRDKVNQYYDPSLWLMIHKSQGQPPDMYDTLPISREIDANQKTGDHR